MVTKNQPSRGVNQQSNHAQQELLIGSIIFVHLHCNKSPPHYDHKPASRYSLLAGPSEHTRLMLLQNTSQTQHALPQPQKLECTWMLQENSKRTHVHYRDMGTPQTVSAEYQASPQNSQSDISLARRQDELMFGNTNYSGFTLMILEVTTYLNGY